MGRGHSGRRTYGSEFETIPIDGHEEIDGGIKFIRQITANNAAVPDYTRTPNRIYAVINAQNEVKFIAYYNENGRKIKQIDVSGPAHTDRETGIVYETPHIHRGNDRKVDYLDDEEKELLDRIRGIWHNRISRQ